MALINCACPHCGTVTRAAIPKDNEVKRVIKKSSLDELGLSVENENVIEAQCADGHEMAVVVE